MVKHQRDGTTARRVDVDSDQPFHVDSWENMCFTLNTLILNSTLFSSSLTSSPLLFFILLYCAILSSGALCSVYIILLWTGLSTLIWSDGISPPQQWTARYAAATSSALALPAVIQQDLVKAVLHKSDGDRVDVKRR